MIYTEKQGDDITVHRLRNATDKEALELVSKALAMSNKPEIKQIRIFVPETYYHKGGLPYKDTRVYKIVIQEVDYRIEGI